MSVQFRAGLCHGLLHQHSFFLFFCFFVCVAFWCNGLFLEAVLLQKFSVQSVFTDALYTAFDSKYMAFYFIGFSGTHTCSP